MARVWSKNVETLQETLQKIDQVLYHLEGRQLSGSEAVEQINHLLLNAGAPNSSRQEYIRQRVQDGFAHSLEGYNFHRRIADSLGRQFSQDEIAWAKANLDWVIVIL